jgi:hypothetical protein
MRTVRVLLARRKFMPAFLPRKEKGSRLIRPQSSVCVCFGVHACVRACACSSLALELEKCSEIWYEVMPLQYTPKAKVLTSYNRQ